MISSFLLEIALAIGNKTKREVQDTQIQTHCSSKKHGMIPMNVATNKHSFLRAF